MSTYNHTTGEYHYGFIDRTSAASKSLILDLFPHEATPMLTFGEGEDIWTREDHNWVPSEAAAASTVKVGSAKDVSVGDLVAIVPNSKSRGDWYQSIKRNATVRDVVNHYQAHLAVVVKVTGRMFEVQNVGTVEHLTWWTNESIDLDNDGRYTDRVSGSTNAQSIHRLGNADDIRARLAASPNMAQVMADRAKVREVYTRHQSLREAARKAEQSAAARKFAPLRQAAKAINKAVGIDVASSAERESTGASRVELSGHLYGYDKGDLARLAVYGRLHLGEITNDQAVAALTALGDHNLVSKKG